MDALKTHGNVVNYTAITLHTRKETFFKELIQ